MTAARLDNLDLMAPPIVKTIQQRSLIIGVTFDEITRIGTFDRPEEFLQRYLNACMGCLGVARGPMQIHKLRHLTKGGWGMVIRRILGAAMRTVPLMALLFLPILIGLPKLYIWARPLTSIADPPLQEHLRDLTCSYLSVHGFVIRALFYFVTWGVLAFFLTKWSAEQDRPTVRDNTRRFKALSAAGLILYAFTISFAAIDWVMSLDPSWISTIYGLLFLIGQVLSALCFAVVVERILFDYKPMSQLLKPDYVHDHGKLMLTLIMMWAYFAFSQWLIIWAGNLPEEITWYVRRLNGGWGSIGLTLAMFHFVVPFVLLLSRPLKRDVRRLALLATWLIIMRYLDLLWIIEPNFSKTFHLTWADVIVPLAIGGLWLAYFFRNLSAMPLLPAYDVSAAEVLEPAHE